MRATGSRLGFDNDPAAGTKRLRRGEAPRGIRRLAAASSGALVVLMAAAVPRSAGAAGEAPADPGAGARDQFPAVVALPAGGPLTAVAGSGQSLTCVQTPVAVDAAGRPGVLAPQLGVTVIRGGAAPSPSLSWVVVPAGQAAGDGQAAVTVCTPTR